MRQRDKSKGKKMGGGLLGRLRDKKLIEISDQEDNDTYYIDDLKMNNLSIHQFSAPDNDIKVSILTLKYVVEKFMIGSHKLSSAIFDFIKDPSGQWVFLTCPCVKLEKVQYKELHNSFTLSEEILPDLELSSNTESTFYIPGEQIKPQESMKYQRSNSYFSYSNIIDTFDETLGDKFRRVMNKLDNIKSSNKIPLHFATKSDLIQDYKSKFQNTQNSNNKLLIKRLDSGDSAAGGKELIKSMSKISTANSDNIERNSKVRNFFTPNRIFDDRTKHHLSNFGESLSKFDLVMVNLNSSKLITTNYNLKYGSKFAISFLEELEVRIGANDCLMTQMNELRCPGMSSILNCKYSIEYEKKVRDLHKPLLISESTYSVLSECVISTLNFLNVSQEDVNLTQNLLIKLKKYIISF